MSKKAAASVEAVETTGITADFNKKANFRTDLGNSAYLRVQAAKKDTSMAAIVREALTLHKTVTEAQARAILRMRRS